MTENLYAPVGDLVEKSEIDCKTTTITRSPLPLARARL